ncbi:amino acid adenylation domain-containing protein [Nonomuraea sp. SMC257]|uniref:Amino acid adenylation domain-containing protein n=1 Tax=Nonomuraea montanisoli TaxID=2741721 RepID=A0A7Y6IAK6_9ACTN|nr:amino acid adenylation domain-containing protein [Nonomuraea montanisoli]
MTRHDRTVTYTELDAWVRATARRLGPDPGVVGVLTSRSPDTVAALLGVLAAGGVYCPIDPAYPWPRREAMIAASGCRAVIGEPGSAVPPGVRLTRLPGPADPPAAGFTAVAADDPAYILFTSGSTGEPKPVVTPRGAISVVTAGLRELFGITPDDRVLQFASLNWDTCLEEILPALTSGATLVFHDHAYSGSLRRMLRMIDAERITVLDLPTAFWHELVHHLTAERAALPPSVRLVVVGGEAVNPVRLADWRALGLGAVRLLNTYGCTETTLITHAVDLHGPHTPESGPAGPLEGGPDDRVPIGRPLPHVVERITEDGELLVGGPALALGYRDRPEATAERFTELDAAPEDGGPGDGPRRWFRTGDRVSRRPDGALLHEGRLDHQLKVRGVRVDPGEVEAQIAGHPRVGAVAVVGVPVAGHTTLAAYVVPRSPAMTASLAGEVLAYLREHVPAHLVPHRITVVPELVHTASGKVDRAGSHRRYQSAAV